MGRSRAGRLTAVAATAAAVAISTSGSSWVPSPSNPVGSSQDSATLAANGHGCSLHRLRGDFRDSVDSQSRRVAVGVSWAGLFGAAVGFGSKTRPARADDMDFMAEVEVKKVSKKARKKVTGEYKNQVEAASEALHSLQSRWGKIEKEGAPGAGQIVDEISGALNRQVTILVPAGEAIGVDADACRVTSVTRGGLGWKSGDRIEYVNDVEVMDQQALMDEVKGLKKDNKALKFGVNRMSTSPFITLEKALTKVYGDADATVVLPDPSDIGKQFREFKFEAELTKDGYGDLKVLKKKLDAYAVEVDKFADA